MPKLRLIFSIIIGLVILMLIAFLIINILLLAIPIILAITILGYIGYLLRKKKKESDTAVIDIEYKEK